MSTSEDIRRYRAGLLATDKYASDRQRRLKRRAFETFDQFLRHRGRTGLLPGARLLDLGAADGSFVAVARERGLEASGLDISDGVNFEHDALPADDASLDIVTASSVIEHLASPARLLAETGRVLRPGGALILVTPNWRYCMPSFFDDPTHVHPYTERSLAKLLANHGFRPVSVVPWLVKKPAWLWDLPHSFFAARYLLPFRGDAAGWIPGFLKGRSAALLALGVKPDRQER
ncbi:MAG: class I SAM-dependent methyltransferase [Alphaproteobacteria bacterium]|nr:class I SAM-dependent methyltransferase [Alphaproteobacteria bacterium]